MHSSVYANLVDRWKKDEPPSVTAKPATLLDMDDLR
jgi:hypothetical protein